MRGGSFETLLPGLQAALIFRLLAAVIVLHTLVDAFTGLEPGVAWTDHLAAGLIPTAILVAAIASFSRITPGAQAAISLALGFLALVGAGIAVAALGADGFDLAVLTGLLMLPTGVALGLLGGLLLWRTRKPEGRPLWRRTLIGLAAAVVWFEVLLPIGIGLAVTHRPAGTVEARDLGRPYEEVGVRTDDGLELRGWYLPSENGAAVITFPSREGAAEHARILGNAGFGVLALDARGYGASEGDPNAVGWGSSEDIEAGVDYLQSRPEVEDGKIGGLGISVGGEMMIEAAARDDRLVSVISDGAGERSVRETLLFGPAAALAIPQSAVRTAATAVFSGDSPPPALDELAAAVTPRALFLIEAEHGQGGEELNADYYRAAGEPKEHWVIPGAEHTGGLRSEPDEYRARVVSFLNDTLLRSR